MCGHTQLRIVTSALALVAASVFATDAISRGKAISIAKDYVHGLHIGDVDCLRISAHRGTTPPKAASAEAQEKMAHSPFWIVSLRPYEKDCAPAQIVYVMTDTGNVWYAANAR
jgi:hypothetical protein